jgi:hypothetical protein
MSLNKSVTYVIDSYTPPLWAATDQPEVAAYCG